LAVNIRDSVALLLSRYQKLNVNIESGKNPLLKRRSNAIAGDSGSPSCASYFSIGRVIDYGSTGIEARAAENAVLAYAGGSP